MYIEKINGPEDVKKLSGDELTSLAAEIRQALLKRASIHGGHFGPNFGMVEATIALHYVFESPKDKFVLMYLIRPTHTRCLPAERTRIFTKSITTMYPATATRRKVTMTIL